MPAKVFYTDSQSRSHEESNLAKVARLCDALNFKKFIKKNELTAVKLHFGEYGNDTHLNPTLVRQVINKITAAGGKPFLTDTTTLYSGSRHNAVDHLQTAYLQGFAPSVVAAPVVIADGLFGDNDVPVRINCKHFKEVHIATEISKAPALVVLSHFKGHQMAGFGGAIKNLAMGGAAVRGKMPVAGGSADGVPLVLNQDLTLLVKKGEERGEEPRCDLSRAAAAEYGPERERAVRSCPG